MHLKLKLLEIQRLKAFNGSYKFQSLVTSESLKPTLWYMIARTALRDDPVRSVVRIFGPIRAPMLWYNDIPDLFKKVTIP